MSETLKISAEHLGDLAGSDRTSSPRPTHFKRRSSIQNFIHVWNQSYQIFPHVFLWVQDFQTSIDKDIRKIILILKSLLALRTGVYLSIAFLSAELAYCMVVALSLLLPPGFGFFLFCIGILSVMAFQIFDVALGLRKKLRGCFFVKKKKTN